MSDEPSKATGAPAEPFQSERFFRNVFARLPDGIVLVDHDGRHLEANEAFCTLVGRAREELLGASEPFFFATAASRVALQTLVAKALREEAASGDAIIDVGGDSLTVAVRASAFESGHVILSFTDVTEQRRTEAALRDSDSRWRSIVANPFDFVCVIDRDYKYLFVNHVEPGIRLEEIVGRATPFDFVEGAYHAVMKDAFEKSFVEGVPTSYDTYTSVLDRWTANVVAPIFDGSRVTALSIVTRDATAAKRAEQALGRAQRLEMLGVMSGALAREFGSLLEVIAGHVSVALDELDRTTPAGARLVDASRAASQASEALRRLGAFERSAPEAFEAVDVPEVVRGIVSGRAPKQDIRLSLDVAQDCPPVRGITWELQRAVQNLIDNAERALSSRGGTIAVTISRVKEGAPRAAQQSRHRVPAVKISVHDDGPGMSAETLAHAFEPFFTTARAEGAAGLGLSMVRAIAMRHGGEVVARSSRDAGTTIDFYLPAAESGNAPSAKAPPQGKRILCIDDEAAVLKLTRRVLERAGHTVVAFQFPLDALARLEQTPAEFDIVITDQTMPRLTGAELAAKVLEFAPELPFLVVSGFCDPAIEMPRNVHAFLQKPVPVDTLLGNVQTATARGRS